LARRRHLRWVHFLPILHLCACVTSYVGLVIPSLQYWGTVWTYIMMFDLPISLVAYGLGWKRGALAMLWVMSAGTVWWYLLGRGIEVALGSFIRRPPATLFPRNSVTKISDRENA
jgi:hypothetical protein